LTDDGTFPNNTHLPLILYRQAFRTHGDDPALAVERLFQTNGWDPAWRNGLYDFHHYHSSAHEALGVYSGWVKGQFGGPEGVVYTVRTGDVIIIPAGVAHKNLDQSPEFRVAGAYPTGQTWDMQYGRPGERPAADERIKSVPLPANDPVCGKNGLLIESWKANNR
jgi:uncharacterized protein YjlB